MRCPTICRILTSVMLTIACQNCVGQEVVHHESTDLTQSSCCCHHRRSNLITIREMWNRDHPDGTQHGHIPYETFGVYYYHRPYNAAHYRQHRARFDSLTRPYAPANDSGLYSNGFQYVQARPQHLFRPLVRKANPDHEQIDPFVESRTLEFADAARYERAKMVWDRDRQENTKSPPKARLSSFSNKHNN